MPSCALANTDHLRSGQLTCNVHHVAKPLRKLCDLAQGFSLRRMLKCVMRTRFASTIATTPSAMTTVPAHVSACGHVASAKSSRKKKLPTIWSASMTFAMTRGSKYLSTATYPMLPRMDDIGPATKEPSQWLGASRPRMPADNSAHTNHPMSAYGRMHKRHQHDSCSKATLHTV